MDRRAVLKSAALGAAAVAGTARPAAAEVDHEHFRAHGLGMLYDATVCIGCKVCMVACRTANDVPLPDDAELWYAPPDLSSNAITVIKLAEYEDQRSFVKRQCMHCVDPACVAACPFTAMFKAEDGVVTWDGDKCVGCRYCEVGCPFNVPKFEWESRNPKIVKCQLCSHRLAEGDIPACVDECPVDAILFGTREELLVEARRRIANDPGRYHPKIYGEEEAGGTQVLYLSKAGIPPESLGFPALDDKPLPENVRSVQGMLYKGFILPLALYAALGTVISRNRRQAREEAAQGVGSESAGPVGAEGPGDDTTGPEARS